MSSTATENAKADKTELPGMPEKPALPRRDGREIENARIAVTGGCSFKLSDTASLEFLDAFPLEGAVKITAYGRVTGAKDSSQSLKDGTMIVRTLTVTIDYVEGAPNREASESLADVDGGD